jgi:hypothetical protein
MIFLSSCRPVGDDAEYDRNQLAAKTSWDRVASAICYFNEPQPPLASPKTRFIPSEPYPRLIEMVDVAADQNDWVCVINADIVVTPHLQHIEHRLKARKAVAASSWRWEFDPAVGLSPCHHVDNGLDFFAAVPGAWAQVWDRMHNSPQGEHDAAKHLRFGAPSWDAWMLGAFFKLFSHMGFYNITSSQCIRHPRHGGRKHGAGVPPVHFLDWPVMPQETSL